MATVTIIPEGDEFTRDGMLNMIFTTAIEGGIGYWADILTYKWSAGKPDYRMIREFSAIIVENDNDTMAEFIIDRKVIARGIKAAYAYSRTWENTRGYQAQALKDLNFGLYEDADFDADTADIIVQFGLFGKLIYG